METSEIELVKCLCHYSFVKKNLTIEERNKTISQMMNFILGHPPVETINGHDYYFSSLLFFMTDIKPIWPQFVVWMMTDPELGLIRLVTPGTHQQKAIQLVADLHQIETDKKTWVETINHIYNMPLLHVQNYDLKKGPELYALQSAYNDGEPMYFAIKSAVSALFTTGIHQNPLNYNKLEYYCKIYENKLIQLLSSTEKNPND
jgi:hypothetical protein